MRLAVGRRTAFARQPHRHLGEERREGIAIGLVAAELPRLLDPIRRGVVQGQFFVSTDELAHCVQKFGGSGANVKLELLVETEHGVTHLEYVDAEPRSDLPAGLMPCVTRALEGAEPMPTPGLPEGLKWRLEHEFLVPPLTDLPKVKWWQRFMPERWRGPPSTGHVG